jgi:hypothetical protein
MRFLEYIGIAGMIFYLGTQVDPMLAIAFAYLAIRIWIHDMAIHHILDAVTFMLEGIKDATEACIEYTDKTASYIISELKKILGEDEE